MVQTTYVFIFTSSFSETAHISAALHFTKNTQVLSCLACSPNVQSFKPGVSNTRPASRIQLYPACEITSLSLLFIIILLPKYRHVWFLQKCQNLSWNHFNNLQTANSLKTTTTTMININFLNFKWFANFPIFSFTQCCPFSGQRLCYTFHSTHC